VLYVKRYEKEINYVKNLNESSCCQGIEDIYLYDENRKIKKYQNTYENNNVKISYDHEKGIISWFDKINNAELIDSTSKSGAFMPVYEITKAKDQNTDEQYKVRQRLGRNMRGSNHKLHYPKIDDIRIVDMGEVFSKIVMDLSLEGTSLCKIEFKIYNEINKADIVAIVNKDSIWDPESLYIALPFSFNDTKMDLFIEKTGSITQPKKEQLPGTNCDFYLSQGSIGLKHNNYGVSIAMLDTSLIYTSKLEYENSKKLYHEKYTDAKEYELYSWTMNNIWETNFKASLGGFIEFNYSMSWGNNVKDRNDLINYSKQMDISFITYRVD
ncbi:MAG: hypothetical protein ACRC92_18975, partial [Peptostreptococcaceae bacterium]